MTSSSERHDIRVRTTGASRRARSRAAFRLAALCLAVAWHAASAQAAYRVTPLGAFYPSGIDDAGRVVGQTGPYAWTPAVWDGGTLTPLPIGDAALGIVEAVDPAGRSAGWIGWSDDTYRAVRWKAGRRELLATPPGRSSMAHGIGRDGAVFGKIRGLDGTWRATVWIAGRPVRLPWLPGSDESTAMAGNGSGLVVGYCQVPALGFFDAQATAWTLGRPKALQGVGGESAAMAVNEAGVIAGFGYLADNNSSRALVWRHPGAAPEVLDDLAGHSSFAQAINSAGTVVGRSFAVDPQVDPRGVIWSGRRVIDLTRFLPVSLAGEGWHVVDATAIDDAGAIVGRMCRGASPVDCQGLLMTPE